MANTATSVLSIAASQLGMTDGTKYGKWYANLVKNQAYAAKGVAWCAMFVSWVFNQAGAKCVGIPGAYCPSIYSTAKAAGKTVSASNAKPGDVVLFDWDGGNPDHVGIVERNFGTYLQTIEGNVSNSVQRRTRSFGVVKACVRPSFAAEPAKQTTDKLVVDGVFGALTCKALQRALQAKGYYKGYAVDGVFGNQTKRAYQQYLRDKGFYNGVIDGVFGTLSVKAEQRFLQSLGYYKGFVVDGARGVETKKALQRALNDGRI